MGTLEDGGEYHLYIGIWCTAGVGNNQCFPYGAKATLSALTTCLTLNWAKLKNLSKLWTEPIQMEQLMANVDEVQDVDAEIMRDSWIPQTMALITRIQGIM